jgi:hypothetical protein
VRAEIDYEELLLHIELFGLRLLNQDRMVEEDYESDEGAWG